MNGLKSFDLPDYQEDDVRLQAMELSMSLLQEIVALIAQAWRHTSPLVPVNFRYSARVRELCARACCHWAGTGKPSRREMTSRR